MSNREKAVQLLDTVPDDKIECIIGYIQTLVMERQEKPNKETLEAFSEVDKMKKTGSGQRFNNLDDLWASLEE